MKRGHRRIVIGLAVLASLVVLLSLSRRSALFKTTVLPSLGGRNTAAFAINDRGQIVGLAQDRSGAYHLVLWDQERKLQDLGSLDTQETPGRFDINNAGQIAGFVTDPNGTPRAFLRDPNGCQYWLGTLGGPLVPDCRLNNAGQIAGTSEMADGTAHAFVWDKANGMRDLGIEGLAAAINDRGQILGYGRRGAFLWDPNDGVTPIGALGTGDLNGLSYAVGWRQFGNDGMYLVTWHKDKGLTKVFKVDAGRRSPVMINDANQIVCSDVFYSRLTRVSAKLFPSRRTWLLWDPNQGRIVLDESLPLGRSEQFHPTDLNNQGCIVGGILSADGTQSRAVLLEPLHKRWGK